jgi:hypothetical protein
MHHLATYEVKEFLTLPVSKRDSLLMDFCDDQQKSKTRLRKIPSPSGPLNPTEIIYIWI